MGERMMKEHVGSLKWMWIPLSLMVFISFAFQRGLATISRTNIAPPELIIGIPYYLATASIMTLIVSILLDNLNARKLMFWFTLCGFCGLLMIEYNPLIFGILFGMGIALDRVGAYSGPMKLYNNNLSWHIIPQGIGRSLSTGFIPLFLIGFLTTLGWSLCISILASCYLFIGYLVYRIMPNDVIKGWSIKEIKIWIKDWKLIIVLGVMSINCISLYFFSQMIPSLKSKGFSLNNAIFLVSSLSLIGIIARVFFAWIGDKWNCYGKLGIITAITELGALFLLPILPVQAIIIHFFGNSAFTMVWWPYLRNAVGPKYVATVWGIAQVIRSLLTSILFIGGK